jgi:hypothetical protein
MIPRASASVNRPPAGCVVVVVEVVDDDDDDDEGGASVVVVVLIGVALVAGSVVVDGGGGGVDGEDGSIIVSESIVVGVSSGRVPSRSEMRASSADRSESPGADRNPLVKASATTRPEVDPQSAPADSGASTVVDVVVADVVFGEKAAKPATASSAMVSQSANAAKRAKRMLFSAF